LYSGKITDEKLTYTGQVHVYVSVVLRLEDSKFCPQRMCMCVESFKFRLINRTKYLRS